MALLPYCVFLPPPDALPNTGIQDRPIRSLENAGLVTTYSELEPQNISGERLQAAALKFHDVLHAVFDRQAVVPFRFPTFLSERELRDHLGKESRHYLDFLREHAYDVQMEVRLWRPSTGQGKAGSGTEYLTRAAKQVMHLRDASHHVQHVAADIARQWKSDDTRDMVRLFALVPRAHVDDFRDRFKDRPRPANVSMRVTGPWPATEFFAGSTTRMAHNVLNITPGEKS